MRGREPWPRIHPERKNVSLYVSIRFETLHKLCRSMGSSLHLVQSLWRRGTSERSHLWLSVRAFILNSLETTYSPQNRGSRPDLVCLNIPPGSREGFAILAKQRSASTYSKVNKIHLIQGIKSVPSIAPQKLAWKKLNRPASVSESFTSSKCMLLTIATPTHIMSPDAMNHPWTIQLSTTVIKRL